MICQCGAHEASVHITEIINGKMRELHLCENCSQQYSDFKPSFDFDEAFPAIGLEASLGIKSAQEALTCPQCGMTTSEFVGSGRLGCSSCYRVFSKMLMPLIKKIQYATQHVGKKMSRVSKSKKKTSSLKDLQEQLKQAVEKEAFEEAAKIRDKIKKIEQRQKKKK